MSKKQYTAEEENKRNRENKTTTFKSFSIG